MLSAYGMTIHCVDSGKQAISLVRNENPRYDLIFMDHMMPVMDGIEATRSIRHDVGSDYAREIPIVALTANATIGIDKMFLDNGFQDYLSKPIDAVKLDGILQKWIRDKQDDETLRQAELLKTKEAEKMELTQAQTPIEILNRPHIYGVDFQSGVLRFGGKAEIYLKIVTTFVDTIPATLDKLKEVSDENIEDYAISVHGVKGSCYSIGADKVGKMAESLEFAAKAREMQQIADENAPFIAAAEELISKLADLLAQVKGGSADKQGSAKTLPEPDKELLAKLRDASKGYDVDEMRRIMDELSKYNYENGGELIAWLKERLTTFSYEDIAKKLAEV
jgi:CheY-like chemotaxis protein